MHSTKECKALEYNLSERSSDKNDKLNKDKSAYSNFIRVPRLKVNSLCLNKKIADKPFNFQLDRGASVSCISKMH